MPQAAGPTPQRTPPIPQSASHLIERIQDGRRNNNSVNIPPSLLTTYQKVGAAITTFFSPLTTTLVIWYTSLHAPHPHDLAPAALSASALLSSFASAALGFSGTVDDEQVQRLNAALQALLSIRASIGDRFGGSGMDITSEELMVDAGCIICCAEVVDFLLMPCRHMILCGVGHS